MADAIFNDKMTALADAVRAKFSVAGKLTIDAMTATITNAETGGGDSAVTYGYINSDGQFQALDLSGSEPVDSGAAVSVDAVMYMTGQDEPDYSVATTATASDIVRGKSAVLNGVKTTGTMPLNTIAVHGNEVNVSAGYRPAPYTAVVGEALGATEYTPGTEDIVIPAGKFLTGDQVIKAVAGGGGSMDFYRCAEYDDGGEIPAYSNITVSGVTSPAAVNATLVQTDKHATDINRVWQYGNYRMEFDQIAGYWCLYDKATILPWAETALFRLKIDGLSDNSGTSANPTWWDTFVDQSARWKVADLKMEQDDMSGYYKHYFYLKLKKGVAYSFGATVAQEWYSISLYLYNTAGSKVASSASSSEAINGVTVAAKLTYTPTADGVYKLEIDGGWDNYEPITAVCYPAPENSMPPATDPWAYTNWEKVTGAGTIKLTAVAVDARAATGVKKWNGYKGILDEDSNTWSFADDVTEGLTVSGYNPRVGEVYSADTSVWVQNLKETTPDGGLMVCLLHGDNAPVADDKWSVSFIDDSATCIVKLLNQTGIKGEHPKFGSRCWFTNYTSSATDEMQLVGLPEMEAFTAEWWQYSSMNSGSWGGASLSVITSSGSTTTITTPELPATNPNRKVKRWFHHALVREAGSNYVFEYVDGVPIYRHSFTSKLGGNSTVAIKTGGSNGTNTQCYGDELAIFNYAKYCGEFRPPVAPYDTIISGLGKGNNPKRAVTVSGIKVMHFANDPSYQLQNASATGTSRQWVTADGKWYIRYDMDMVYGWVICNGTNGYSDDYIVAARLDPHDGEDDYSIDPIGHTGWVDYNDQTVPVSVLAN